MKKSDTPINKMLNERFTMGELIYLNKLYCLKIFILLKKKSKF